MSTYKITKRYARKVSRDYQTWEFVTELTHDTEINSKEDLINESTKLFNQCVGLTNQDIESCMAELKPQEE